MLAPYDAYKAEWADDRRRWRILSWASRRPESSSPMPGAATRGRRSRRRSRRCLRASAGVLASGAKSLEERHAVARGAQEPNRKTHFIAFSISGSSVISSA